MIEAWERRAYKYPKFVAYFAHIERKITITLFVIFES